MKVLRAALLTIPLVACAPSTGQNIDPHNDAGTIFDPNVDHDGDGYSQNQGDCNDRDATIYPGATELCDGKDHNCNHIVDDICDDDKDGYAVCPSALCPTVMGNNLPGGDCDDTDPAVNPGAVEFVGNMVDDDCDGMTDESEACTNANLPKNDSRALAAAAEICDPWVRVAQMNADANVEARDVKQHYGVITPRQGGSFLVLSTGIAADENDPGYVLPQDGTSFGTTDANPLPMNNSNPTCGNNDPDENVVNDYVELTLTLQVPTNAQSFSFQFFFMSAEYPEFVGTPYNDKFLVVLDSKSYKGNISFDKNHNPITVNAGFFGVCDDEPICTQCDHQNTCALPIADLDGTGYEQVINITGACVTQAPVGGGTGWLTTTSPVTPGETATLRFIIFDENDFIYDSAVLIDNFQWQLAPSSGPTTVG